MNRLLLLMTVFLSAFHLAHAQRTIYGTVTSSENNNPLIGVTIVVQGSSTGTTTDFDGKYSLTVGDTALNLFFSFIGRKDTIVPIGFENEINVAMEVSAEVVQEIVVTALAVAREKRSLGYSTTTIKTEEITRTADRSPIEALRGKVSGANITTSNGDPGASTRIVLRGGSSILGNNQALIVVDGVPIDNSNFGAGNDFNGQSDVLNFNYDAGNRANDLNPQDIESVTVLKGPAAAALYGSRAANGALIITTKSGNGYADAGISKKFKVSFNSNYTFSNILKLPEFQNEYGQGGEKLPDSRENFSWGPKFDDQIRPWGQEVEGKQKVKPYSALPNNVREFFDLGKSYNNNISIEGGGVNTAYYLSYNNIKTTGVIPGTANQRNSLRGSVTHNFTDKLSSTITLAYVKTEGDLLVQGQTDQSAYYQILQTPRDISLLELEDLNDPFNQPETYYSPYTLNPWHSLTINNIETNVDRLNASASVTYSPLKWLDITGRFGTDVYTDTRVEKFAKYAFENQSFPYEYVGRYLEDLYRSNLYNSDIIIEMGHTFKNGFSIGGLLGNNIFSKSLRNTYASTAGLNIDGLYNLGNSDGRPVTSNRLERRRTIGAYGEVNFDYKKYLFVNFSARNDWSSTLPEDDRSYFYPSVNGAFILTEVLKMDRKVLSFTKIRGGFAKASNGGEDPYLLTNVYVETRIEDGFNESEVNSPYPSVTGDVVGAYTVSNLLRNPELKPESVTSWEVGLDIGFWKDIVTIDFTYYQSKSKDLILVTAPVAPSSGYTDRVINAGSQTNKGVELGFNIVPVLLKNFKWELYGTFTKNKNRVDDLPDGVDQISLGGLSDLAIVAREGEPYGSFYGVTAKRDPQGRVVVDSITGQPLLDDEPKILGSYQPDWFGSLGTSFSWKGLKFSILFDTRQGGKIWSRTMDVQEFVGTSPNTLYNNREDFIVPNSVIEVGNANGEVMYAENTSVLAHYQDYWTIYNNADRGAHLLSASFIKLREISLSYTFPTKMLSKSKFIAGAEIRVYGSNLALWTPKENTFIDPETSSYGAGNAQGFEYGTTPSLRSFGCGFRLDF